VTSLPGASHRNEVRLRPSNLHSIAAGMASLTGFDEACVAGFAADAPFAAGDGSNTGACTFATLIVAEGGKGATDVCDAAAVADDCDSSDATEEVAEAPEAGGLAHAAVIAATEDAGTVLTNAPSTTTRLP
jgi:hypothetical protein